MELKWIGAIFVVTGCGLTGLMMALSIKKEYAALRAVVSAIGYMRRELSAKLTYLPDLCKNAAQQGNGCVSAFFSLLSKELEGQVAPDVRSCVDVALGKSEKLPEKVRGILLELGTTLGSFDVTQQLSALEGLQQDCEQTCRKLDMDRNIRMRNYQTLGLCAGAALAILLL